VVYALGRWAGPLMARPLGDDEFRVHWLRHVVVALFEGGDHRRGDLTVAIRLIAGRIGLAQTQAQGVSVVGDARKLSRLRPRAAGNGRQP
jgi:hypothetical protein